mmetsp:Transcript_40273/g.110835  ORF Transcript_40273/g.110835 Transcript_40273/m.110835 type:complete len:238 (-) Transcript_40273:236-949(-)
MGDLRYAVRWRRRRSCHPRFLELQRANSRLFAREILLVTLTVLLQALPLLEPSLLGVAPNLELLLLLEYETLLRRGFGPALLRRGPAFLRRGPALLRRCRHLGSPLPLHIEVGPESIDLFLVAIHHVSVLLPLPLLLSLHLKLGFELLDLFLVPLHSAGVLLRAQKSARLSNLHWCGNQTVVTFKCPRRTFAPSSATPAFITRHSVPVEGVVVDRLDVCLREPCREFVIRFVAAPPA